MLRYSCAMFLIQLVKHYLAFRIRFIRFLEMHPVTPHFFHQVLEGRIPCEVQKKIECIKTLIYQNKELYAVEDLGARSRFAKKKKTVGNIARTISIEHKYGNYLYQTALWYKPDTIIEMGTAFGISTMYLSLAAPESSIITMEGNRKYAEIAERHFSLCNIQNVTLWKMNFGDGLPLAAKQLGGRNLVFIDGNHTLKATVEYFTFFNSLPVKSMIIIFDDINWSQEVMEAWQIIKSMSKDYPKADLFRMGILFKGCSRDVE